jgi:uncharacterized protein (DUF1330 family)
MHAMSSYLVYICQAVNDRAGLERYWQLAPAVCPENVDVLVGYAPFEVLDADQDERVEGVVIAEFPPFEQTVEWFNGDAYVQARKDRTEGNEYLGMLVDSRVAPISKRSAGTPAYVVLVCREIADQEELNTYWERVNGTLVGHPARIVIGHSRLLILEGQSPVEGVTVYEFPSRDAARSWYDSMAYREVLQHRKAGAKHLVILAEGGVPPVEQRMPHTRIQRVDDDVCLARESLRGTTVRSVWTTSQMLSDLNACVELPTRIGFVNAGPRGELLVDYDRKASSLSRGTATLGGLGNPRDVGGNDADVGPRREAQQRGTLVARG